MLSVGNLPQSSPTGFTRMAGFTIVELMVGVVIGMLGVLVIMQAMTVNESYRRSTGGTGQAQANGAVAIFSLERELRMAGHGISYPSALNCGPIFWYNFGKYFVPAGPMELPEIVMAPVLITDGGAMGTDTLQVVYSTSQDRTLPVITQSHPAGTDDVVVDSSTGFKINDLFLIAESNRCMMFNVKNTDPSGISDIINRMPKVASFTPPSNNPYFYDYQAGAEVFNLGQLQVTRYAISGSDLVFTPILSAPGNGFLPEVSTDPQILASGIVDMKAWYGIDNNGNDKIDSNEWTKSTPSNATGWLQVKAVRIALLVRSGNFEKPSVTGGTCEATTNTSPNLLYRDPTMPFNSSDPTSQLTRFNNIPEGLPSCYKYRAFETVVPLRNMIWRLT